MTARPPRERGFALLLVIWVLAILAVVAAGFAAGTRSETRLARNLLEAAEARALAEAGVARATASLLEVDPRARWPAEGTPRRMSFDGGDIQVRIEDEDGKIDLNLAPTELLSGLCAELALSDDACAGLAAGVAARRRAAAAAAAAPRGAPVPRFGAPAATPDRQDAAFTTIEELRQLPALDAASFARLRPFVTVYAQSERIDPAVAPREVLLALPGVDPGEVERLLAARAAAAQTLAPLPPLTGAEAYVAPGQLHAATIIAAARSAAGASFTQRSVIALTGQPLTPVQVLEWRQEIEGAAE